MNAFALASLLASVTTVFLGIFVLYRNPKGVSNRVFFLYCLSGSVWAFTEFGYRQAESFDTALFWMQISSISMFSLPLQLHFLICFTKRAKLLRSKLTFILLYLPALVFLVMDNTGPSKSQPVETYWGWTYELPRRGNALHIFEAWFLILACASLILIVQHYLRVTKRKDKWQTAMMTVGISVPLLLAFVTEPGGLLNMAGIQIPELTSIGVVLQCIILAYAMWRFELFPLNPVSAAGSIIATLADALILVDNEGKIAVVNQATLQLLGYTEDELLSQPVDLILAPGPAADTPQPGLEQLRASGSIHDAEVFFVTKDAGKIPISLSASAVRDGQGAERGIVYVGRDLTERKQAEEQIKASLREKDTLLAEIHHRVKNNLQLVSSLLYLQSKHVDDQRTLEVLRESRNRVHSMASIHELLYRTGSLAQVDFGTYTRELVVHLLSSYGMDSETVRLKVDIVQSPLSVDAAVCCGLIIHELVSNSLKHAFPAGQAMRIVIALQPLDGDQMSLTVSDNGVGLPPDMDLSRPKSLGLQLVSVLVGQLEGTIKISRSGGTAFHITFRQ